MALGKIRGLQSVFSNKNNATESVNNQLKSFQSRKQLLPDMFCSSFLFVQRYIHYEMQYGRVGFGNFKLREDCSYAKLDPDEIQISELPRTPEDMLNQAKQLLIN